MKEYQVVVIEIKTGETVKTLDCSTEKEAVKVDTGICYNLNHAEYSTDILHNGVSIYD